MIPPKGFQGAPVFTNKRNCWAFPRGSFRAAVLACVFSIGFAVPVSAQSLREELRELIRAHPRIEESRAQLREADEIVRQARSGFLPNVSATGSFGAEMVSNPGTRLTNDDNEIVRSNALGVEIRQPVFDGGFAWNDTDAALLRRESGAKALDSVVQEIMLQGVTAYIEILRLSELIRVARARERTIRKQENLETERVERGAGIEVDVLQAKSRLQLAIEARVDLEGQLRTAAARYINVFQRNPDITLMRLSRIPPDLLPATLEEALYIASTENPQLAGLELLAKAARVNVDVQRAAFFPSIDVVGRWDHESNVGGTRNNTKDMAVLLEMSWEVFTGFRNEASVAASHEFLIQALTATDQGTRDVNERVRQAWTKLENTRLRKELLINAVSIAQEVFTARQELRDIGKATSLEVLDAENEVFQAEQNLIRADYDNRNAVYELAFAMGLLSPAQLDLDIEVIEDIEQYLLEPEEVDERPTLEVEQSLPAPQGDGDPLITPPAAPENETISETAPVEEEADASEDGASEDGTSGVIESPPTTVPAQEALQESALPRSTSRGETKAAGEVLSGEGALSVLDTAPNLPPPIRGGDGAIATAGSGATARADSRSASEFAREIRGALGENAAAVVESSPSNDAPTAVSTSDDVSPVAANPTLATEVASDDVAVGDAQPDEVGESSDAPGITDSAGITDLDQSLEGEEAGEPSSLSVFSSFFAGSTSPRTGVSPEEVASNDAGPRTVANSIDAFSVVSESTSTLESNDASQEIFEPASFDGPSSESERIEAMATERLATESDSSVMSMRDGLENNDSAINDPIGPPSFTPSSDTGTPIVAAGGGSSASVAADAPAAQEAQAALAPDPVIVSASLNDKAVGAVQSARASVAVEQEEPGIVVNRINDASGFDVPGSLLFGVEVPPAR